MTQTQCGNLCAPAVEESIITDLESGGSLLGSSRKGSPDLVLAAAFDNDDLQPKAASRRLRTLDIVLQNPWDLWVHEQGDLLDCGKEFMQQLQPLWSELTGHHGHPRGIAARTVEARDKPACRERLCGPPATEKGNELPPVHSTVPPELQIDGPRY